MRRELTNWSDKTLNDLVSFKNGLAHENVISENGKYVVVNSKFISTEGKVAKFSNQCLLPVNSGDILMVMSDVPNGRAIAKCFIVEEGDKYTLNQRICALTPQSIHGKLLYYLINRNPYYLAFDDGVKQTNLRRQDVLDCPIKVPEDITEQKAIATALSDVDELIANLENLIEKKKAIKQGAMQQLLTPPHKGGKRLEGFSGEWVEIKLKELVQLIPAGHYGIEKPNESENIPFPVVTTAHITSDNEWNSKPYHIRFYSQSSISHYLPKYGDLIIVKASGSSQSIQSGKMGFVDKNLEGQFLFSNFQMLIRPININPYFLYSFLTSNHVKKLMPNLVEASTYPNIKIHEYMNLLVPKLGDLEEQEISNILYEMDKEIEIIGEKIEKANQIKLGMMQELLTGRTRLI